MLETVLLKGKEKPDRTGVGTISYCHGLQFKHDLSKGYPLLTTKKINWKYVVTELLWFLHGRTDNKWLQERGCEIWTPWAKGKFENNLGRAYGYQFRRLSYNEVSEPDTDVESPTIKETKIDQIASLLKGLQFDPYSRRHIISLWNPRDVNSVALPPCHGIAISFTVDPDDKGRPTYLNCHMYQRSQDIFIGGSFNIARYALLTHLIAKQLNLTPKWLIISIGDAHIYLDHLEQVKEQLKRKIRELPDIELLATPDLIEMNWKYELEDLSNSEASEDYPIDLFHFGIRTNIGTRRCWHPFDADSEEENQTPINVVLSNYNPHPFIKAPVAV